MKILALFASALLLFGAGSASGHGSGASLEQIVGERLIDIGYEPAEIEAGGSARFDFELLGADRRAEEPFTDIWVRISEGEQTVFAGGLHKSDFGATGLTHTFPRAGSYSLFVRFENGDETLAEHIFPLEVLPQREEAPASSFSPMSAGIGAIVGAAALGLVTRLRISKQK